MLIDSVVCWRWTPTPGYRSEYPPKTVNVLKAMVDRWYPHPHRFICVCDDKNGIDSSVEMVKPWDDFSFLPSPHGKRNPSCYRRLRMFHPDIGQVFGERFVSLDLDVVLTGDVSPLWNRPEDFVAVGDTNPQPGSYFNGSMMLLRAGSRPQVWTRFDPDRSPYEALRAGAYGSDQGHISHILGSGEARWSKADGVYSLRNDFEQQRKRNLPADARIVICHGKIDPWSAYAKDTYPWISQYWTAEASCAA